VGDQRESTSTAGGAAACLAIASTSSAQDDKPDNSSNSLKQDAGTWVPRQADTKEAVAVVKRDSKEAGQAIARGRKPQVRP